MKRRSIRIIVVCADHVSSFDSAPARFWQKQMQKMQQKQQKTAGQRRIQQMPKTQIQQRIQMHANTDD